MSNKWQVLKPGDKVYIVAPGGKPVQAGQTLAAGCDYLRGLGLIPIYSDILFGDYPSFYHFANTDQLRYQDFITALTSDAAAILPVRGGYGCDRVIELLIKNQIKPMAAPKLFIGLSDNTNLHNYMTKNWQWSTLHGPGFAQLALNKIAEADKQIIEAIMFGKIKNISLTLTPLNTLAKNKLVIESEITGGNLAVMQAAINTPWAADLENKIVLFEEIDEAPYQVSRALRQLLASNMLLAAKAVILGDFIYPKMAQEMELALQDFADHCPIPVLRRLGIGHGKNNHAVPFATPARLTFDKNKAELIVETGGA